MTASVLVGKLTAVNVVTLNDPLYRNSQATPSNVRFFLLGTILSLYYYYYNNILLF